MRWARSYSIVDHALLHEGHLGRLSHVALSLYLFLVVVSDRDGKSYYKKTTIMRILRLSQVSFEKALYELFQSGLVDYRPPFYLVKNIGAENGRDINKDKVFEGSKKTFLSSDRGGDFYTAKEGIQNILRQL